jgi:hypothetical protein
MTPSNDHQSQYPPNDLIIHALGHGNDKLTAHMEVCPACRGEVELYRSILMAVRGALNDTAPAVQVRLMDCRPTYDQQCEAIDSQDGFNLILKRENGCMAGQVLDWPRLAFCWPQATIRLFGHQGLISTSKIDHAGHFRLNNIVDGEQYSLGLALSHGQDAELRIVGNVTF